MLLTRLRPFPRSPGEEIWSPPSPIITPDAPLLTQVLYKVCNSFVEMGSANVRATDYLKGVGQYLPLLGGRRRLPPSGC